MSKKQIEIIPKNLKINTGGQGGGVVESAAATMDRVKRGRDNKEGKNTWTRKGK